MKKRSIVVIFLLSLLLVWGCSKSDEPVTTGVSRIEIVFDGETCLVAGNESGPFRGLIMEFDNQSDSAANLITLRIKENHSADEIFLNFLPGSTELPEGTMLHFTSRSVQGGSKNNDLSTKFYEGTYAVLCKITATQGHYFGGLISINR